MLRRFDKSQKVWFVLIFGGLINGSNVFNALFELNWFNTVKFVVLLSAFFVSSFLIAKTLGKRWRWEPRRKNLL